MFSDPTPVPLPRIDEEPSISLENPPEEIPIGPEIVTFEIVEAASRKQKSQLIDSRGYSYNVKEVTRTTKKTTT